MIQFSIATAFVYFALSVARISLEIYWLKWWDAKFSPRFIFPHLTLLAAISSVCVAMLVLLALIPARNHFFVLQVPSLVFAAVIVPLLLVGLAFPLEWIDFHARYVPWHVRIIVSGIGVILGQYLLLRYLAVRSARHVAIMTRCLLRIAGVSVAIAGWYGLLTTVWKPLLPQYLWWFQPEYRLIFCAYLAFIALFLSRKWVVQLTIPSTIGMILLLPIPVIVVSFLFTLFDPARLFALNSYLVTVFLSVTAGVRGFALFHVRKT